MGRFTLFINDTFAMSWRSVLLVEETEVFSENNQPLTRNVQVSV